MEKIIFPTVITAVTIICICIAWCFSYWAKHKERLLMIEIGQDPNTDKDDPILPQQPKSSYNRVLKVGILIIGLSIGLLIVKVLGVLHLATSDIDGLAVMGISCGISLIIANYLGKAKVDGN